MSSAVFRIHDWIQIIPRLRSLGAGRLLRRPPSVTVGENKSGAYRLEISPCRLRPPTGFSEIRWGIAWTGLGSTTGRIFEENFAAGLAV